MICLRLARRVFLLDLASTSGGQDPLRSLQIRVVGPGHSGTNPFRQSKDTCMAPGS